MDATSYPTPSGCTLYCALELSKNSWLLAIQFPDRAQPSLYPIEGGNTEKLMAKLTAAQDCWAKVSGARHIDEKLFLETCAAPPASEPKTARQRR